MSVTGDAPPSAPGHFAHSALILSGEAFRPYFPFLLGYRGSMNPWQTSPKSSEVPMWLGPQGEPRGSWEASAWLVGKHPCKASCISWTRIHILGCLRLQSQGLPGCVRGLTMQFYMLACSKTWLLQAPAHASAPAPPHCPALEAAE